MRYEKRAKEKKASRQSGQSSNHLSRGFLSPRARRHASHPLKPFRPIKASPTNDIPMGIQFREFEFPRDGRALALRASSGSGEANQISLKGLLGDISQTTELFLRVGDCENQDGIDRLMNGRRYTPTVRSGMERSVPTFFHGSTDVRASSPHRTFSDDTVIWRAALCCLLFVRSAHGVELGFFRRGSRFDQAVGHAIETNLDERLLDESSAGHLAVPSDCLLCDLGFGDDDPKYA
jgi:hypothetical protein